MQHRFKYAALTIAAVLVLTPATFAQQRGARPDPTAANGPPPANPKNLTGKWNRVTPFQTYSNVMGGANEFQNEITLGKEPDLTRDTGLKYSEVPFTPAGKAAFDKNIPGYGLRITPPRLGNDPQGNCDPWGIPRMLNGQVAGVHSTWEILQAGDRTYWFVPWHHEYRMVWTDGRKLPEPDEIEPKWNGYSVGSWEGNTFVVSSVGFDPRTWLDHNGYPHTEQMKLEERYRLLDADTLEMTETIIDPEYYSAPFKSDVKIWKRDKEHEKDWDEQIYCVPSEEFRLNSLIRDGNVGKTDDKGQFGPKLD